MWPNVIAGNLAIVPPKARLGRLMHRWGWEGPKEEVIVPSLPSKW